AIGGTESVIPDFFEIPLTGSEKILLCSDGLTNMVEDEEILDIIQKNEGLENQVKELIHLANRNGGRDNIAVVLVDPSKR
ncbi:MAG: serine/threonine-protein phosphatase, partial [Lachnospiraceae bacterium]